MIAYVAELGWGAFALRYAGVLDHQADRTRVTSTLRGFEAPALDGAVLTWSNAALQVHGAWRALMPLVEATIFDSGDGRVEWRCLQPASLVALRIGGAEGAPSRAMAGLGYVEHVALTVPPWRMPIDELHWGRFVSSLDDDGAHASVVWIDWRGRHAARVVHLDGVRVEAEVSPECVVAGTATLSLDRGAVLREGTLGATVLGAIPELAKRVPGRLLGVHERKWRSRAVLERAGRRPVEGWAIHEVVRWP